MKNNTINTCVRILVLLFLAEFFTACASQTMQTPAESTGFSMPSMHEEIMNFCFAAARQSKILETDIFGQSVEGRDLIVVKAAKIDETPGAEKLRVLLFAQQHGNEQAGKEGALLLIRDLANGLLDYLLDNMEIWIVPQVNPDGGELNQRRNAINLDLNRDHLVQEAPETRALHGLFRGWLPHVTIDVHEYQPYRESWAEFGGYKNFDMQVGVNTNINIEKDIRIFSLEKVLAAIKVHLSDHGYSFHNYIVGPPPTEGITRYSSTHFDDGRQGFGILNTMSFIFEGINGRDGFKEALERRSQVQLETMKGLLHFLYLQTDIVTDMVNTARNDLNKGLAEDWVAIQTEYVSSGEVLMLPLKSSVTGEDTLVVVERYKPLVEPVLQVERPRGYLIPRMDERLMKWVELHDLLSLNNMPAGAEVFGWNFRPMQFDWPEKPLKTPVDISVRHEQYIYIPTQQLHSNFLVLALEPLSDIGLVQEPGFDYLLKEQDWFPVYRVE